MLAVLGALKGLDFANQIAERIINEIDNTWEQQTGIPRPTRFTPTFPNQYAIRCPNGDWEMQGKYISQLFAAYKTHWETTHKP
jgi:hypothetical protein